LKSIQFIVPVNPVAQGRPRFASKDRGGKPLPFVKTYDPKNSRDWKKTVMGYAIASGCNELLSGALKMILVFRLQRPKSHYGKKGLRPSAPKYHTVKSDLSNYIKGVEDALEGICYKGDQQICKIEAKKEYADDGFVPCVIVRIEVIKN
jgi:Holliday junction resolvase RusA-like endonuclease